MQMANESCWQAIALGANAVCTHVQLYLGLTTLSQVGVGRPAL